MIFSIGSLFFFFQSNYIIYQNIMKVIYILFICAIPYLCFSIISRVTVTIVVPIGTFVFFWRYNWHLLPLLLGK